MYGKKKLQSGINLSNIGGATQGIGSLVSMYGAAKGDNAAVKAGGAISNLGGIASIFGDINPTGDINPAKYSNMPTDDLSDAPIDINKAYEGAPDPIAADSVAPNNVDITNQVQALPDPYAGIDMYGFSNTIPEFRHGRRGLMAKYGCYVKPKGKK